MSRRNSQEGSSGPGTPAARGAPPQRQLSGSLRRGGAPEGGYAGGRPAARLSDGSSGSFAPPYYGGSAAVRPPGSRFARAEAPDPAVVGWNGAVLAQRYATDRAGPRQYGGLSAGVGLNARPSYGDDDMQPRGWEPRARQGVTLLEDEWEGIRAGLAAYEGKKPQVEAPPPLAPIRARGAVQYLLRRLWYLFDSRLGSIWFQTLCLLVLAAAVILGSARFFLWQLGGRSEPADTGAASSDMGVGNQTVSASVVPQAIFESTYTEWTWNAMTLFLGNGYGLWETGSPDYAEGRLTTTVIIIFAILYLNVVIAIIVSAVQIKMRALKYGLSPVVESGHTVVLGFNAAVLSIIRELCLANESEGGGVVVVLERGNTIQMAAELKAFLSPEELMGTKVVFRNGTRLRLADLEFVSAHTARAVIAVADQRRDADTADAEMLQVMLNLSGLEMAEGASIVAEVRDVDSTDFIQQVASAVSASVTSHDIVGSLLLFFVRQPGLMRVYNAVLGFTGSEFYVAKWPELTGRRWSDVTASFPHAVPIGLRRPGGAVLLNPPAETRCTAEDELIVLAEDNDTYKCEEAANMGERRAAPPRAKEAPLPEVMLLLGWRRDLPRMLELFDRVAPPHSELHIVCDLTLQQREEELEADGLGVLNNVTLVHHVGPTTSRRTMQALPLEYATSALILSAYDERIVAAHSDSHALATLTLLRRMHAETQALLRGARAAPKHLPICVQILDPRTQRTVDASAYVWRSADFVLSNELTSKMLAMISEDLSVKHILEALVGEADTYLSLMHPSECLPARARHGAVGGGPGGGAASFWELSRECTLEHGATLIGYMPDDDTRDPHAPPPACIINPEAKAEQRTWGGVRLVVIKRDPRLQPPPERANSPGLLSRTRSGSPTRAHSAAAPGGYDGWQQRDNGLFGQEAEPEGLGPEYGHGTPQALRSRGAPAWSPNALYEPHLVPPA